MSSFCVKCRLRRFLFIVLGLKKYSLKRPVVRQGDAKKGAEPGKDLEKGPDGSAVENGESDDEGQDEKMRGEVRDESGAAIPEKGTDNVSMRPATGTTLGVNDSADEQR